MSYIDIHFCSDKYLLISDNKRQLYLSNEGYKMITLIGFNIDLKISFICYIYDINQLGCIYYQLHEYNPRIYGNNFNIFILDPNKSNIKLKKEIIYRISLYNKYWLNKINFMIYDEFNINTEYNLMIDTISQQIMYNNTYKKSQFIDKRYFFNSLNCNLLLE